MKRKSKCITTEINYPQMKEAMKEKWEEAIIHSKN